ncbi:TPA: MFS transporter [Klebsiella pneumoniae]|uniref:MFS transporter n=1 Tax=Klebsiella pneumoniae TaxID=573 RepID=UPI0022941EC4|nr:MFS transporter [Klebsiella pneumoniae]MCP6006686.1 MFS transporter [Klebsiella pneumoniae]MDP1110749.1 MFS transporter [Klebsiella pneumoniae]MEA4551638.1 MFS transporter [Klebsiella pneumoniae]HBR3486467.1 MFS transporter [Klebsiella pneumoniae]HBT0115075.1 MFS transporter [Klebsiella pneumoniae]
MNTTANTTRIRWWIAGLMWLAIAINYIDRTVLSAAAPHLIDELKLDPEMMGFIMAAFFWSYSLLQIPAGWFADRFGQNKGLGLAVAWWSIATSMMGVATGFKSLLALRLALGVGEAAAYPSNAGIAARWFPDKERATVSGLFDSASKFGGAIAMPLIVWMIYTFDWRLTFLIIGSVGILWVIAWYFIYAENPEEHKRISPSEVRIIRDGQKQHHGDKTVLPMKWYKLLRYRNIWAMCIGFFTINYTSYFFITWLPTYLVKEKGMDFIKMGMVAALPLLCGMVIEVFAGWASDRLVHKKVLSLTATRKLFLTIGLLMALCIGFAPFTDSVFMTVFLLCVAKSGTTVAASQVWALPGDIAPKNSVSIVAGLQNTVSNMGGAVGPIITGAIVAATGSFNWALIFSAILVVIGIINYLFLMGKIEPINDKGGKSPVLNAAEQH